MKTHKTLIALTLAGVVALAGWTTPEKVTRYVFTPESKMWVEGTSTVHAWKAEVKALTGFVEVGGDTAIEQGGEVTNGSLTIFVSDLDANNGTMNKKMRDALKADDHNAITFELISANTALDAVNGGYVVTAKGNLTLAGVKKPIEVRLDGKDLDGGKMQLKGNYELFMTDYGIRPPTAMLGTMKTGDKVTVYFELVAAAPAGV